MSTLLHSYTPKNLTFPFPLRKAVEEEVDGGKGLGHTAGIADELVVLVPNGSVVLDFPLVLVVAVAHDALVVYLAQIGVVLVSDNSVALGSEEQAVANVPDVTVVADLGNHEVTVVPDGAVALYCCQGGVAGASDGLGAGGAHDAQEEHECEYDSFHHLFHNYLFIYKERMGLAGVKEGVRLLLSSTKIAKSWE